MKRFTIAASALALLVLAGCGGSGGSNPVPETLTKEGVLNALNFALDQSANIRDGGGGQNQPRAAYKPKSRVKAEEEEFFYSDFLDLWVLGKPGLNDDPLSGSGFLFYADEARTQPAGHELTWVTFNGAAATGRYELEYLAGNFAGEWHKETWTDGGNFTGSVNGSGHMPEVGSYEFSGEWTDGGVGHWVERFDAVDGTWQEYDYLAREDFTTTLKITSSHGIVFTLNFSDLGSGSGSITGPAEGLPATIEWDDSGIGVITWADGTTSEIDVFAI